MDFKKIAKRIIVIILILPVIFFILSILLYFFNSYIFNFYDNDNLDNKYIKLFNETYKSKITLTNSSKAIKAGYSFLYSYNSSSEISVMELSQYDNISINNINIKNYLIESENKSFYYFKTYIHYNTYPNLLITLYVKYRKIKEANLYIKGEPEKFLKEEDFLYLKFNGNSFTVSSTEKYGELNYGFFENEIPIELLILRDGNRVLFITKYSIIEGSNDNVSLLDLIKTK